MNDDRRARVLRAIVEDYVATKEPVGSKALVERHSLGVSSATIRNDMAALEAQGLIAQPHTSAGRIPTDKGYRAFVDTIDEIKPLSAAERRAVSQILSHPVDIDDMLERTVRLLASLTSQVAVIQYPVRTSEKFRHLELVDLGPGRILVVFITDSGHVDQRIIESRETLAADDVATLRTLFNAALAALPIDAIEPALALLEVPARLAVPARAISHVVVELVARRSDSRLVLAGTANLARTSAGLYEHVAPLLEAFEEQVVLLRLLTHMSREMDGVTVSIGEENPKSLAGTSVVATNYGTQDSSASLAVLGPTRMDYPTTIAAVRAVASYVSGFLDTSTTHHNDKGHL